MSRDSLNAIILAAGSGSRLMPLTQDRPKGMVDLGGVSLLERHIGVLTQAGVERIVIVGGYHAETLVQLNVEIIINPRWAETNMVETLFCAVARFGSDTIVAYGDILYEPRILTALLESPHEVSVVVDRGWRTYWEQRFADPLSDAETLRLDHQGRIIDIGNRPHRIEEIEAQYIGLMRFRDAGIDRLRETYAALGRTLRPWLAARPVKKAYMTDLLMEMTLLGNPPHAVTVERGWWEIDTAADYELARAAIVRPTMESVRTPPARYPGS